MANNIELLSTTENFTIGTNSNLSEILANVVKVGTDTSNVTISIPQDISSSYNLILPVRQGASGESLVYGADGQLKWDDPTVLKQVVSVYGSNLGSEKVDVGEMSSVSFPTNYEASITPLSANTKIFVQFKINYKAALSSDNQVNFYIYKNDTNGNTLAIFSETMYGPYIAAGGFVGQYISNLIDEPNTTDEITYKLGYKINGTVDISDTLGILGYDVSYNNTIVLQEFEGSGVYSTSIWNKGSDNNGLYYNEGTVHIGSTKNALGSQNTTGVALELSGNLVGTNANFSGNITAYAITVEEAHIGPNTLYINGTRVLNQNQDTGSVNVYTDQIISESVNGLTIQANGNNGNIILDPSGTGSIQLNGDVHLSGGNINAETFIGDLSGNVNAITMAATTTTTNEIIEYTSNSGVTIESVLIKDGNVNGNLTGNVTGNVNGNLTGNVTGDVSGNVSGVLTGSMTMTGHILPDTNSVYDIGSAEYKVRHMYLSNNSLWIGDEHKATINPSNNQLEFRRRKTDAIPQSFVTAGINDSSQILSAVGVGALTEMTLAKWKQAARTLDIPINGKSNLDIDPTDIFDTGQTDDWQTTLDVKTIADDVSTLQSEMIVVQGNISPISGGTGVTYSNGSISIGQSVGTSDNVQFNNVTIDGTLNSDDITGSNVTVSNDLVVSGNLTVNGTRTIVNATTLDIGDNKILVNAGGSTTDAGIIANVSGTEHEFVYSTINNAWKTTDNIRASAFIGDGSQLTGINEDQTVVLTGGGATTVSGTYPNFTILSTDTDTTYTAGTGISINSNEIFIGQEVTTTSNVQFNTIQASAFIGDGSQLTNIGGSSANLTDYSDASFNNIEISGNIIFDSNNYISYFLGSPSDYSSDITNNINTELSNNIYDIDTNFTGGHINRAGQIYFFNNNYFLLTVFGTIYKSSDFTNGSWEKLDGTTTGITVYTYAEYAGNYTEYYKQHFNRGFYEFDNKLYILTQGDHVTDRTGFYSSDGVTWQPITDNNGDTSGIKSGIFIKISDTNAIIYCSDFLSVRDIDYLEYNGTQWIRKTASQNQSLTTHQSVYSDVLYSQNFSSFFYVPLFIGSNYKILKSTNFLDTFESIDLPLASTLLTNVNYALIFELNDRIFLVPYDIINGESEIYYSLDGNNFYKANGTNTPDKFNCQITEIRYSKKLNLYFSVGVTLQENSDSNDSILMSSDGINWSSIYDYNIFDSFISVQYSGDYIENFAHFYIKDNEDSVEFKFLIIDQISASFIAGTRLWDIKGSYYTINTNDNVPESYIQISKGLALGSGGTNQGVINLKDNTNIGIETVAEVKGILDGTNGGQLKFLTKVDEDSTIQDNLIIANNGDVKIVRGNLLVQNQTNSTEVLTKNVIGLSGNNFVKGMVIDNPSDTGANFYCGLGYDAAASSHYCYIGHDPYTTTNGRQIVIETKTSGYGVNIKTPGNLFTHYNGVASYLVTTAGGSTSDDRCKFNETQYTEEEAFNDIKQLNFKKYKKVQTILTPEEEAIFEAGGDGLADRTNYEKELAGKPYDEIGLVAQEVPESLKSILVTEGGDNTMWAVKYENIIGMCVNCIKNLEKRIAILEEK